MQKPEWLQPGLWGAVCGAIALSTVGFSYLGWKSATSAEQSSYSRSDMVLATFNHAKFGDSALARACSERLQTQAVG